MEKPYRSFIETVFVRNAFRAAGSGVRVQETCARRFATGTQPESETVATGFAKSRGLTFARMFRVSGRIAEMGREARPLTRPGWPARRPAAHREAGRRSRTKADSVGRR